MRGFLSRLPAKIQILPLQTTKRIDIKQVKKMGLFSIAEIILERFPCNIRAAARIPRVRRQSRDGCQKKERDHFARLLSPRGSNGVGYT